MAEILATTNHTRSIDEMEHVGQNKYYLCASLMETQEHLFFFCPYQQQCGTMSSDSQDADHPLYRGRVGPVEGLGVAGRVRSRA